MDEEQIEDTTPSRLLGWLGLGGLPAAILLSLILFTITEGGEGKFGIAVLAVLIILPLGALVSIGCLIYWMARTIGKDTRPCWLRWFLLFLHVLVVVVGMSFAGINMVGELLGFYGILAAWFTVWLGACLAYYFINDSLSRQDCLSRPSHPR